MMSSESTLMYILYPIIFIHTGSAFTGALSLVSLQYWMYDLVKDGGNYGSKMVVDVLLKKGASQKVIKLFSVNCQKELFGVFDLKSDCTIHLCNVRFPIRPIFCPQQVVFSMYKCTNVNWQHTFCTVIVRMTKVINILPGMDMVDLFLISSLK